MAGHGAGCHLGLPTGQLCACVVRVVSVVQHNGEAVF